MGIKIQKEWIATLDQRTRDSHGALDGEIIPIEEKWETINGHLLEYPGDPAGHPSEVYNCRCTMRSVFKGINDKKERVLYPEWLEAQLEKEAAQKGPDQMAKILEGQFSHAINTDARLQDIAAREHSAEVLRDLKKELESDTLKIENIREFDGDPELLRGQVAALKTLQEEYKLPALKIKFTKQDDLTPAETQGSTIYLNILALRSREITEAFLNSDNFFAATKAEGISEHEVGHLIQNKYGNKALDILRKAYYNIYKKPLEDAEVLSFLENNVSLYSAQTVKNYSIIKRRYFKEITGEMISKNRTNPDEFSREFERVLKEEVLK